MNTTARLSIIVFAFIAFGYAGSAEAQYSYFPLSPCRAVDTRNAVGTNGGPALPAGVTRNFQIKGTCGVPTTAKAVSINVTITGATAGGWLAVWPASQAYPGVSTINFNPGDTLANGAIVGLGSGAQDLSAYNAAGTVNLIVDVTGYFQ